MAEDNFKTLIFALILTSLFGMLILTAVNEVGNEYGVDTTEVSGGTLSISKFNASISSINQNATNFKKTFEEGSVWSIAGVVVSGIFDVGKNMFTMVLTPFFIVSDIMLDIFNIPPWVTSVLLSLLIIAMIFGIWNLLKVGN